MKDNITTTMDYLGKPMVSYPVEDKLSLFDYLGKPAGMELGKKVFKASVAMNIKIESRYVDTKTYCGKIMLYPKDFLEIYFKYNR